MASRSTGYSVSDEPPLLRRYRSSNASKYQIGQELFGGVVSAVEQSTNSIVVRNGLHRHDGTPVECRREHDIDAVSIGHPTRIFTSEGWSWIIPLAIDRATHAVFYDRHSSLSLSQTAELDRLATHEMQGRGTDAKLVMNPNDLLEAKDRLHHTQKDRHGTNQGDTMMKGLTRMATTMQLAAGKSGLGLGGLGNSEDAEYRLSPSEALATLIDEVFALLDESNDEILVVSEVLHALGQHSSDMQAAQEDFEKIEQVIHCSDAAGGTAADGQIDFQEWRDYWESTAAGDSEEAAIVTLEAMQKHLKHVASLHIANLHQGSTDMSMGQIAEQRANMMTDKKRAVIERQEIRQKKELEDREDFAVRMIEIVELHEQECANRNVTLIPNPVLLNLVYRSSTPKLYQMCVETFSLLDANSDNVLSFPEVLNSLGEENRAGQEKGPSTRRIETAIHKHGMDKDKMFKVEWREKEWIQYWQSTEMPESVAIARLSSIRRRMLKRQHAAGLKRSPTMVRKAQLERGARDANRRNTHAERMRGVEQTMDHDFETIARSSLDHVAELASPRNNSNVDVECEVEIEVECEVEVEIDAGGHGLSLHM